MNKDRLRLIAVLLITSAGLSCSRPDTNAAPAPDSAAQLQSIPAASREKYETVAKKDWPNPHLIVRQDGIGLVDLANNEIHILKPNDVGAALAQLPPTAWPFGRVVGVEQKSGSSDQEKANLRATRALLVGTLQDLKVEVYWIPSPK